MGVALMKTLATISVGTLLAFVGYILYNIVKEKDEPENQPMINNFHLSQSDGHGRGVVKNLEIGEKRIMIEWFPRDLNYIKEMKNNKNFKIKPIKTFYKLNQVEILPIGTASMHRTIINAYPNKIQDLNNSFRKTDSGKAVMSIINDNNKLEDSEQLMQQRLENLKRVAEQTFGGEIFKGAIAKFKEITKDFDINRKDDFRPTEQPKK